MSASVLVAVWMVAALPVVGAAIVWATVRFTIDDDEGDD